MEKIGIAGAMSLNLLPLNLPPEALPQSYSFPFTALLINAFLRRGHEVVAYTMTKHVKAPRVLHADRLTVCIAPWEPHAGWDMFASERRHLVQLMRQYPADIINAQWSYEFGWAALSSGIPSVITLRDHAWLMFRYQPDFFRFEKYLMSEYTLRRAKHLITNSEYLYALLPQSRQRRARVVHNFYPQLLDSYAQALPEKDNYIISVANAFGERKNLDKGLEAFAILRQQFPDLSYYLVGANNEEGGKMQKWAEAKGLSAGVVFKGKLPFEQTLALVQKARLLFHPSQEESFGNVLIEALMTGTAVVGGKSSGNVPFLLGGGRYGALCEVNQPQDMANTLAALLNNEARAKQMVLEGREFIRQNLSEDIIIDKLLAYYRDILGR